MYLLLHFKVYTSCYSIYVESICECIRASTLGFQVLEVDWLVIRKFASAEKVPLMIVRQHS